MIHSPILGVMRETVQAALMRRRSRLMNLDACAWHFGSAAYVALVEELRRDHGYPGAGAQLTPSIDGIAVEEDPALAPDAFYLKEP